MNDTKPGSATSTRPGGPATIVVCVDDTATLDLLCEHLAADRFAVLPAPSASDALRLCRYNRPEP